MSVSDEVDLPNVRRPKSCYIVVRLLIKTFCRTENERIMSAEKVKSEFLYQYIMNTLTDRGNFVVELFISYFRCFSEGKPS